MIIRNLFFSAVFALGNVLSADDFNFGLPLKWEPWATSDAESPAVSLANDAAEGDGSLLVRFPKSGETSLIARTGLAMPQGGDALSLWAKRVSGAPACYLLLEEDGDVFRAVLPIPDNGQWAHVVVPFSDFSYEYSVANSTGNHVFEPSKLHKLMICAYHAPPFSFLLDAVEFVKMPPAKASPPHPKNLLRGDTSFETGVAGWTSYLSTATYQTDSHTGAVGASSLKFPPETGGASNGWQLDLIKPGRPYTLSFYAKGTQGEALTCTVVTENWKYLAAKQVHLTPRWARYELAIPGQTGPETPYLSFGKGAGTVWLDAIQLEEGERATPYEPADPVSLHATSGAPGDIVVQREAPLAVEIRLFNSRCPASALPLSLYCTSSELSTGRILERTLTLHPAPGQGAAVRLELLPRMRPGYYTTRLVLRTRAGDLVNVFDCPVAVVRPPPAIEPRDSFFGMHPNYVPLDALRDIGVRWLRLPHSLWQAAEPKRGEFQMGTANDLRARGFEWYALLMLTPFPGWATGADGLPTSPDLVRGYVAKVVENSAGAVGCYDFQNEPDLTLGSDKAKAARVYAALLNAARPAFAAAKARVAFDVSGDGLAFARAVIKDAPGAFDVFAPHPYTNPRYIGPTGMAISPEAGGLKEKLLEALAILKTHGLTKELWIGELGWALDVNAACDSPSAVRQAAYLARAHLLARSVPELKRLIWFTSLGQIEGGHYEYGVWRNEEGIKPLPAAAAYANLANLLDGAVPLPPIADGDVKIYAFKNGGRTVLAVWDASDADDQEPLPVEIPPAEAELRTFTGAPTNVLSIGAAPSFAVVAGNATEAVVSRIRAAVAARRPVALAMGLPDLTTLAVSMRNCLSAKYSGTLDASVEAVAGTREKVVSGRRFEIPPDGCATMEVALPAPFTRDGGTVVFELHSATGGTLAPIRKTVPSLLPCPFRRAGVAFLDAPLPASGLLVADRREQVLPADPTIGWNGPQNLSAKAAISWDAQYLYFMADVTDDRHCQPFVDGNLWMGDSIQLAIDARNDAQPNRGYDNNDSEYGVALTARAAALVWRWQSPAGVRSDGEVADCLVKVTRTGTCTRYRLAIPWRSLGIQPKPGTVFGLNFIVPDNDGSGRNFWIGMAPGIAEAKLPALYNKFVLQKDSTAP